MKSMVFTDSDLDGVSSLLAFLWFHKNHDVHYCDTTATSFRENYTKWLSKNNPEDYDKIFILDLDVHEHKDLIDTPHHFIIDHHKTHAEAEPYKNAKAVVKVYSSACKLTYKVFKTLYDTDITEPQKKLILICDDYDSWEHCLPQSKMLNMLYWHMQNRFATFLNTFRNGFTGFDYQQSNIIKMQQEELNKTIKELSFFSIETTIQNQHAKIVSTFATKFINDVSEYILNELGADIAIVVNMNSKHVSYRRSKKSVVDLLKLVRSISSDGGGHEYAAGSSMNNKFIEFTKVLTSYVR